jgi:glycosyltransferase involved in cell wall biosynthesis
MRIAAYTAGKVVPSARFRIRQLIPYLAKYNIVITEYSALPSIYPPDRNSLFRLFWFFNLLFIRIIDLINGRDSDVIIFQKELISSFLTFEVFFKKKSIFDVDDAIWLKKYSWPIKKIARNCRVVVVGNNFLKNYFSSVNKNIYVIPTAIDSQKYIPSIHKKRYLSFTVGWIGTSGGFKFFTDDIQKSINNFFLDNPSCRLKIVADKKPNFKFVDSNFIDFVLWTEDNEVSQIQSFDIGIMPLDNSEWSLGKCSYKMLLYMSCSIPVIVTNVGMNSQILSSNELCGFGVNIEEPLNWKVYLDELYRHKQLRFEFGKNGRKIVERTYSLEVISKEWVKVLNSL